MSSNNYRFRGINLTSSVVTNLSNVVGSTVTAALNTLNTALGAITSSMVQNLSVVAGATVTNALDTLNGLIAGLTSDDVSNASAVVGVTVSDALDTLNTAVTNTISQDRDFIAVTTINTPQTIPALTAAVTIIRVTNDNINNVLILPTTVFATDSYKIVKVFNEGPATIGVSGGIGPTINGFPVAMELGAGYGAEYQLYDTDAWSVVSGTIQYIP